MKKLSKKSQRKLKELGVGIVYLFGSRVAGTALNISDYDIGVVFVDNKKAFSNGFALFGEIYNVLSEDFPESINGPRLDISFLERANAGLQISAVSVGRVLFEVTPSFRADYEESVIKRYDDYLCIQKGYEEATFRAFANN
ncbi:MAG: nucleotidyltransferase domain-containing protein [bacterium]|nr:nucleotidyltransferase domain-containing protein [bacterium]